MNGKDLNGKLLYCYKSFFANDENPYNQPNNNKITKTHQDKHLLYVEGKNYMASSYDYRDKSIFIECEEEGGLWWSLRKINKNFLTKVEQRKLKIEKLQKCK